ncbi:WGxxGxxG family protein [Spongiactinospora sp. TRM90649]|uniref:WGxxGxxG family protein n=1 Tax=Spongiactinospora sp. TRM90649 TaxID=3031114 RepID=UPI0023F81578|nr:WGxxGxxG family protein [Spongiactinospora sp. TRM90649]MDF5759178.1 WGxxGxxG-CTERM domain-containing protein [Spongiactinospora sp. TRM90649]
MRRTLAGLGLIVGLGLAPTAAIADAPAASVSSTQVTPAPQPGTTDDGGGNAGLWGLLGLIGLVGLAGLRKQTKSYGRDHVGAGDIRHDRP